MIPLHAVLLLLAILVVPLGAHAEPVDTNQFGHIREGMPESQVLARLGPPDHRRVLRKYIVSTRTAGGSLGVEKTQEALIYLGDGRIMDTYIILLDGMVTAKEKRR